MLPIALDAMGGDKAPESVVQGARLALRFFPDATFIFLVMNRKSSRSFKKTNLLPRFLKCITRLLPSRCMKNQQSRCDKAAIRVCG